MSGLNELRVRLNDNLQQNLSPEVRTLSPAFASLSPEVKSLFFFDCKSVVHI